MTDKEVADYVRQEIRDNWSRSNDHGLDLSRCLVSPTKVSVIMRHVENGIIRDEVLQVWLVLEERIVAGDGYKIVFDEKSRRFGLASPGFPCDAHPVLCSWYGDFLTTFAGI